MWKKIELIKEIIAKSNSKTEVLEKLNLKNNGGNYNTLSYFIQSNNIDISHFTPKKPRKSEFVSYPDIEEVLVKNSPYRSTSSLKSRLYNERLKVRICELCGQDETWQGKKMSLILDHINGDRHDNRIENLRIVCPNCNATLETHCRGLNLKQDRKYNKSKKCDKDGCENMIRKSHNYCISCWKEIRKSGKDESEKISFEDAMKKRRKVHRPSYEQLLLEVSEFGYVSTGKKYKVSDNTIRKWIKMYQKHGDKF